MCSFVDIFCTCVNSLILFLYEQFLNRGALSLKKTLTLIIMDGFGVPRDLAKSAITHETTPNLSRLFRTYPTTQLVASGNAVGLPEGQMGNSEVGHMNIGAGRVVYQELTRITKSIDDGTFFSNLTLKNAMLNAKKNNSALHLMGLLSDGGVHSHQEHLFALLVIAKKLGLKKIYVHAFLDGRDVLPTSGKSFVSHCQAKMREIGVGRIATLMGRYYAMDRDNRWERTKQAYDAIANGIGSFESDPIAAVEKSYVRGVFDEFIHPIICDKSGTIKPDDSVIFFNFRPDRARQITRAFVDADFSGFERRDFLAGINFVCMTRYDEALTNAAVAFEPETIANTFGEVISRNNLTQLRIAETEKYAHVTFFFNGGVEGKFCGEDRILIPSPKVATYDLQPGMSALELTKIAQEKIKSQSYDVIILNFANCDMVGHTGNFEATKNAVKTVDSCVDVVVNETLKAGGCAIITADHGNAEQMLDDSGQPFTAHTTNTVPLCVVGCGCKLKSDGKLADIAPTMLEILNIEKPAEMFCESLIMRK